MPWEVHVYEMAMYYHKSPWEMEEEILNLPVSVYHKWMEYEKDRCFAEKSDD